MRRKSFPLTFTILPGCKWTGKLRVLQAAPEFGKYVVEFDAEDPNADPQERFVFDRAVLTKDQIKDWTGIDLLDAMIR